MENIYTIMIGTVLGWLLGILSPSLIKKISNRAEKANLEKIIFNDLRELKKRLALLSFTVYPKYGKLDMETFEWIKKNSDINFSEGLKQMSKEGYTEENLLSYYNEKGLQNNTHSNFKKMNLFVTDSHLSNFGLIDKDLIEKILEVKFHVAAFNEEVDGAKEYLNMTFLPGITLENHNIVSQELKNKNYLIAEKSIFIVDKINAILDAREGSPEESEG